MKRALTLAASLLFSLVAHAADPADCTPVTAASELNKLVTTVQASVGKLACPTDDELKAREARAHYEKEFPDNASRKVFSHSKLKLKGTAAEFETLKKVLSTSDTKIHASWPVVARSCATVLCAVSAIYGSEEAGMRVLALAKYSGYTISAGQVANVPVKDQQLWTLEEIRILDKAVRKLPPTMLRLKTMDAFIRFPDGYRETDDDAGVAAFANSGRRVIAMYDNWRFMFDGSGTLVHEMAHHYDYSNWNGRKWFSDSSGFSALSGWKKGPLAKQPDSTHSESFSHDPEAFFVSDYAGSEPMEDFAEAAAYYVFDSKKLEQVDPEKYALMKEKVFKGIEYKEAPQDERWPGLERALASDFPLSKTLDACFASVASLSLPGTWGDPELVLRNAQKKRYSRTQQDSSEFFSGCIAPDDVSKFVNQLSSDPDFCSKGTERRIAAEVNTKVAAAFSEKIAEMETSLSKSRLEKAAAECISSRDLTNACILKAAKADPSLTPMIANSLGGYLGSKQAKLSKLVSADKLVGGCLGQVEKVLPMSNRDGLAYKFAGEDSYRNYSSTSLLMSESCIEGVRSSLEREGYKLEEKWKGSPFEAGTFNGQIYSERPLQELLASFERDVIVRWYSETRNCGYFSRDKCRKETLRNLTESWARSRAISETEFFLGDQFQSELLKKF